MILWDSGSLYPNPITMFGYQEKKNQNFDLAPKKITDCTNFYETITPFGDLQRFSVNEIQTDKSSKCLIN